MNMISRHRTTAINPDKTSHSNVNISMITASRSGNDDMTKIDAEGKRRIAFQVNREDA